MWKMDEFSRDELQKIRLVLLDRGNAEYGRVALHQGPSEGVAAAQPWWRLADMFGDAAHGGTALFLSVSRASSPEDD